MALYKQHWWKCNGPCQKRPPFYGMVKRSMNRAPGPYDRWFAEHQANCGGTYTKVREPEGYGQKKGKKEPKDKAAKGQKDIRSLFGGSSSQSQGSSGTSSQNGSVGKLSQNGSTGNLSQNGSTGQTVPGGGSRGNIFGFGGTSFGSPGSTGGGGGLKTKGWQGLFRLLLFFSPTSPSYPLYSGWSFSHSFLCSLASNDWSLADKLTQLLILLTVAGKI